MPEYVGICLIMLEYAWVRLNLNEWLLFHVSPLKSLAFLNTCLLILTKFKCSLKEHEAVSLKRQNLVLDEIFLQVRFKTSCYLWGSRGRGSWILIYQISIFNRRLINVLCFKSNWFDFKLNTLHLDWRQE